MTERKTIKTAAAIIAMGLVSALIMAFLLVQSDTTKRTPWQPPLQRLPWQQSPLQRLLLNQNLRRTQREGEPFDPNSYAYLIIHYHKTGHVLSRQLRDFLILAGRKSSTPGPASNNRVHAFRYRMHEESTGCPRAMELSPGIVYVAAAPDFFCDDRFLAESLLRNDDAFRDKLGVKVIHLVRDPFALSVSNFVYHAQWPTPEKWVNTVDPCTEELWFERQSLGELVGPTLMAGEAPVVRAEDVGALHDICKGIYRNSGGKSKEWSYYQHLRHLDSRKAIQLATTHMTIQGLSGGDMLRMANNIVKLKQVQQLEDHIRASQHVLPVQPHERMIQVMTLSMTEFTEEPRSATLRFLDFALEDAVTPEVKEKIAADYEQSYNEKLKSGNEHITADKEILNGRGQNIVKQKGALDNFLRKHNVFGRVLGNIERLVNDSLRESGSGDK